MSEPGFQIRQLQNKVSQLIKLYQSLQKENASLINTITEQKKREAERMNEIEQLYEKVLILKVSSGTMEEGTQKEFENRINQYIKEIDHCIGMLSE